MDKAAPLSVGPGQLVIAPRPHTAPCTAHSSAHTQADGESRHLPGSDELLTLKESESQICLKLRENLLSVKSAFRDLDPGSTGSVSREKFKSVMRTVLSLSGNQLSTVLNEVCGRNSVAVDYMQFLRRYSRAPAARRASSSSSMRCGLQNTPMSLSEIQKHLIFKIGGNLRTMIRAFRLFDYDREGRIKQHNFRIILEKHCFPLTDKEFQRLWNHYSPNNMVSISYKMFLDELGFGSVNGNSKNFNMAPVCTKLELSSQRITPPEVVKQKKKRPASQASSGDAPATEGLVHGKLENLFHEKMCVNLTPVWQTLQACDVSNCGLVKRDVLRTVLSNFLFPMNPHTFQKLTSRYGVQATGQVKWRHFLGHFMSPVKEDDNMTVHTDSASEQPDPDLQEFYPHLREIFHLLDKRAAGWITRADLRLALKVPHFHLTRPKTGQHSRPRLSCSQITDLLNTLDPEHTGFIQLPTLERLNPSRVSPPKNRVALLPSATATAEALDGTEKTAEEQKASDEKQNTQRADNTSPASASWRIVESLLLDRLCEQLGSVLAALRLCDPQQTGHVKREDLRKVIVRYGLPISLTHIKRLSQPYTSSRPGSRMSWVCYTDFLRNLGVPLPDETTASSSSSSDSYSTERQNTSHQTTEVSAGEHQPPSSTQSVLDDIFKRMKERLEQLRTTLADRMQIITHSSAKTYSETDLRKMLEDCFITLDDNNFHRLTELLGFKEGRLSLSALQAKYDDFLARDRQQGVEGCDEISAAEKNLADMKNRIKIIHGDNMKAFRLMDKNHDGLVDCRDFKKLYFSLGYAYWGEEYQHLLNLIGLKPGRNLNYTEFCNIMENNGHHKKQQTANVQDQLHALLASDARDKWRTMSQELCRVDAEGRVLIFKKALKYFLFTYKFPIRSDDFERLWSRYDTEGRGFVTVADFLNKLGVDEEELWPRKQKPTHTVTPHQADKLASSDDAASLEQIEQILLDNYKGMIEALTHLDENRDGKVKVEELLSLLQTYGCSVQRAQLIRHLRTLNVSVDGKHRLLSYLHFLSAFGHTAERCEPPPATPDAIRHIENLQDLRPALALVRMQELVTASAPNLRKAFSSFDPCGTGTVKLLHFRQVLENFCARLSDKQFRYLLNKVDLNSENYNINWKVFLDTFNSPSPLIFEDRAITARSAFEIKTYLHKIQEVVSGRLYEITKDIMDLDLNQSGTVSKDDFRKLCDRCFMRLTSNQFECVWNQMPVNEQGKLQYREFLKRFGAENKTTHTQPGRPTDNILSCSPEPREIVSTTKSCRPKTADAILQNCKSAPQCISRPASTPGRQGTGSPLGSVEQRLRGEVQRCWKKIQRKCNERDPHRQGEITTASFLDILQSLNISVTQEEFEHLAMKFDITRNGQVSYPMFLRHFLLNLKPAEVTQMFERRRLPLPTTLANQGVLSRECVESMLRIYGAVKLSWSSMKRSFRTFDRARTGYITIQDFMKVLCHFNVNLSSEEFFHLSSYFDASATGKISYNDFLRVFLS